MKKIYFIPIILFLSFGCNNTSQNMSAGNNSSLGIISFIPDKKYVRDKFLKENFKPIAGDMVLNKYNSYNEDGLGIVLGDINGDTLVDAVVDYSLSPKVEETGGGNGVKEVSGMVVYLNNGKNLEYKLNDPDVGAGWLTGIEKEIIMTKGLTYADTDALCCPSVEGVIRYKFDKNKLIKIDQ